MYWSYRSQRSERSRLAQRVFLSINMCGQEAVSVFTPCGLKTVPHTRVDQPLNAGSYCRVMTLTPADLCVREHRRMIVRVLRTVLTGRSRVADRPPASLQNPRVVVMFLVPGKSHTVPTSA